MIGSDLQIARIDGMANMVGIRWYDSELDGPMVDLHGRTRCSSRRPWFGLLSLDLPLNEPPFLASWFLLILSLLLGTASITEEAASSLFFQAGA